jgi:hypothetical protein
VQLRKLLLHANHRNMKNNNTRAGNKYLQLSELGSKFNLSFSSHLGLGNKIIALDGLKKKLLVVEIKNGSNHSYIIELDQVETISIKKTYSSIKPGELNKKGLRAFLKSIYLQFEYCNKNKKIVLPFYERETDGLRDLSTLERNAMNWQMILSKMTNTQNISLNEKRQLLSAGSAGTVKNG